MIIGLVYPRLLPLTPSTSRLHILPTLSLLKAFVFIKLGLLSLLLKLLLEGARALFDNMAQVLKVTDTCEELTKYTTMCWRAGRKL